MPCVSRSGASGSTRQGGLHYRNSRHKKGKKGTPKEVELTMHLSCGHSDADRKQRNSSIWIGGEKGEEGVRGGGEEEECRYLSLLLSA